MKTISIGNIDIKKPKIFIKESIPTHNMYYFSYFQ